MIRRIVQLLLAFVATTLFASTAALAEPQTLIEPVSNNSQSNVVFTDLGGGIVQVTFSGVFDFSDVGGSPEPYSGTFTYDTSVPPVSTPSDPNVDIASYAIPPADFHIFGTTLTPIAVGVLIQDGNGIYGDFFTLQVTLAVTSGPGAPVPNTSDGLISIGLNAGAYPPDMFTSAAFPTNLDVIAAATGTPTQFAQVLPSAVPRTFTFTGTVTVAQGSPFGVSASVGDPVSGIWKYDANTPGTIVGSRADYSQGSGSVLAATVGGTSLSSANHLVQIWNDDIVFNQSADYYAATAGSGISPILVNGTPTTIPDNGLHVLSIGGDDFANANGNGPDSLLDSTSLLELDPQIFNGLRQVLFIRESGSVLLQADIVLTPVTLSPPTANAGPDQNARAGNTVLLDGTASFDDNTATADLIPHWSIVSAPATSTTTLVGADTLTPSMFVDVSGTYEVELTVTDTDGLTSTPDTVVISNLNLAPTANAGPDQLTYLGSTVMLNGNGSTDPEGDAITYDWEVTAPSGIVTSLSGVAPPLTVNEEGVYVARLTVSDFLGPNPVSDTAEITVTTAESFAEASILSADDIITMLDPAEVTTSGNQNALTNFFSQAARSIRKGNIADAISKLQNARNRTDGCVERGVPDDGSGDNERDWILSCADQALAYTEINNALDALGALTP